MERRCSPGSAVEPIPRPLPLDRIVFRREVRVFPLVGLDALPYPQLDGVIAGLQSAGIPAEVREVPYEFQKGARHMLRLGW